jgi:hypothetical protein
MTCRPLSSMTVLELRAERERLLRELLTANSSAWAGLYRRLGQTHKIIDQYERRLWPLRKKDSNA